MCSVRGVTVPSISTRSHSGCNRVHPVCLPSVTLLLRAHPAGSGLSEAYVALFPPLLSPILWRQKGYVPALTVHFLAFISTGMTTLKMGRNLEGILGIFQELVATKAHEAYAYKLLNNLLLFGSFETFIPYVSTTLDLQLRRMKAQMKDDNKTPRYAACFSTHYSFFQQCLADQHCIQRLTVWIPDYYLS